MTAPVSTALVLSFFFAIGCGSDATPRETVTPPPGELIGRIEVAADLPLGSCQVVLEGTPLGSRCDASGQFDIRNVPVGRWDLRVIPDPDGKGLPARRVAAASNSGFVTDIGAVRLAPPGAVGGHIAGTGASVPFAVISVPAYGVVTAPNPNGGYLLAGVPPGVHEVVLTTDEGRVIKTDVTVLPTKTTIGVDFDLTQLTPVSARLAGTAIRQERGPAGYPVRAGNLAGVTVELVEILDGQVIASATTDDAGRWELSARQGPYLVRARDASRPLQAIVPYVLLYSEQAVELAQTLVIPPDDLDLDGDGALAETDEDDDGDGEADTTDAFPLDPAETTDVDSDGVGDHADLRTQGTTVDEHTPTPDTDGDGLLDFEDSCPALANADQIDADADGVGNVCDNCPFIPNPEQTDSIGNGEGDACRTCIDGTSCTPANPCEVGFLTCTTGGPVCATTGVDLPNGDPCGPDMYCSAGECTACAAGDACTVPGNPCVQGVLECATGVPVCAATQVNTADGTPCGANQVCASGACVACTTGATCTPAGAPCHVGAVECSTGAPVCTDTAANRPDGSSCGTNLFCNAGACEACPQDDPCTPTNVCHAGHIECGSGTAVCVDDGTPANDNATCGAGRFCQAGACTSLPDQLVLVSGGGQSGNTGAQLGVVTLRLQNGGGQPIAGRTVTFGAPAGGAVTPASMVSSAQGLVQFTPRLPTSPGSYSYTATAPGAPPVSIPATAVTPTPGVQGTIGNIDHTTTGGEGLGGPAIAAHFNNPQGLAVAPDGTIYFIDQALQKVKKIAPDGTLSLVAGTGVAGAGGDLGPATAAQLSSPRDLALDPVANVLYIADTQNNRVRAVNLATGIISTYAGGGTMGEPFGDGGPASAANIGQPSNLALGPDRSLYIAHSSQARIRKVDVATNVISTYVEQGSGCSQSIDAQLSSCSFNASCAMAFDAAGRLFVAGTICGRGTSGSSAIGILRRDPDGRVSYVGGRSTGITSDGVSARAAEFASIESIALDAAGNLFFADSSSDRVRRIDGATGLVTTIMGTGTSGSAADNVPAAGQPVADPRSLVVRANGDLLFTELGTDSIRRISGAGTSTPTSVTLAVNAGNGQTTEVARTAPLPLSVRVSSGASSVVGVTTEWEVVDEGAAVFGSPAATNPSGVASISARAGLLPGAYRLRARFRDIHGVDVPGSPKELTLSAVRPAAGTIYTVVNTSHSSGADGFNGPSTAAHIGNARGVTVTSDGTIYVADHSRVYEVSPRGFLRVVAGNGQQTFNGDFGTATSVSLNAPSGLAVDEATGTLYIADTNNGRIRGVDLASESLFLVAGGGANVGPGFGDDGPGSAANLSQPQSIVFDAASGFLYIGDQGHSRVRRLRVSSGVIEAFIDNTSSCSGPLQLQSCTNSRCGVAVDSQGVYVAGFICGTLVGGSTQGILRRNNDGTLTHITGKVGGVTTDGVPSNTRSFSSEVLGGVSSDGANLYLAIDSGTSKVFRFDLTAGTVTTLAGTGASGFSGEYGPATAAQLSSPDDVFAKGGNVYIADTANACVRLVE